MSSVLVQAKTTQQKTFNQDRYIAFAQKFKQRSFNHEIFKDALKEA